MPYKRLPNGFGNVSKLPGKRRNPFRARKRIGVKNGKPLYATIGYFATREEALRQLALNNDTTLVREPGITFKNCLDLWWAEYELKKPMPKANEYALTYIEPLYNREMRSLKAIDLETLINSTHIPRVLKRNCIVLLHGAFGYAMRHEIIDKDYSKIAKYATDTKPHIERKLFTAEQIEGLWKTYDRYDKVTLVLLYTGMRVGELLKMRKADVHLDDGYMVGGSKTDAGKNRFIPIHSTIYQLVKAQMQTDSEFLFPSVTGGKITNSVYTRHLKKIDHTPHDTRHTFISQAYKCGIAEPDIKRIVGHAQSGVTQAVYVHPDLRYLCDEIEKLFY